MIEEKDINDDATAEGDKGSAVDKWLNGLSDAQLAGVKATVNAVAEQRQVPDFAHMSDNEFREHVRKRHGFSPV
jgi:hypothetical protein